LKIDGGIEKILLDHGMHCTCARGPMESRPTLAVHTVSMPEPYKAKINDYLAKRSVRPNASLMPCGMYQAGKRVAESEPTSLISCLAVKQAASSAVASDIWGSRKELPPQ
jgi:hypothetical protein